MTDQTTAEILYESELAALRAMCRCDGSGLYVVCIDDICRGLGECIHGDGMATCPCGGDATADDYYDEGGGE